MNKLLFFSLSLLMSIPAFSMEEDHQDKIAEIGEFSEFTIDKDLVQPNDLKNMFQTFGECRKVLSEAKKELQKEKVEPATILEPFNQEIQKIKNFMKNCYEICTKAERDTTNTDAYKVGFDIEHASFEEKINNLYSTFLAKQTTAKICVGAPSFNTLIERTKNISSEIEKLPRKNDHIIPFSETMAGLLESLKHAKEHVEK